MGVQRAGVVGAGVMGSEIAQVFAAAGLPVVLVDVDPAALERGLAHVAEIGRRRIARGRLSPQEADAILARVTPATDLAALAGCDLVVEAVPEVLELKRRVWRQIGASAPPEALLASNTSGLSITELGRETPHPDRMVGLHFFNPASVMRLVEVIRGEDTSDRTLAEARDLVAAVGKTGVEVRECPGFLVNRVLVRAVAEAFRRAAETSAAASSEGRAAVDAATVAEGPAPMGPFTLGDLVGLDTLAHIRRDLERAYGDRFADGGVVDPLVAAGRLGRKSGAGFYEREAPAAEPTDQGRDVAERYYLGALHEACLCLEDGIAAPADVDLALELGTGWSQGPLAWADAHGLDRVAQRMAALAADAPRLAVPAWLAERAARGDRLRGS